MSKKIVQKKEKISTVKGWIDQGLIRITEGTQNQTRLTYQGMNVCVQHDTCKSSLESIHDKMAMFIN